MIQIIGRAARNINGKVIMYADQISQAMEIAINETKRRREIQIAYNQKYNIIPKTIIKPINEQLANYDAKQQANLFSNKSSKSEIDQKIKALKKGMLEAAKERNYELAMQLRDQAYELEALKAQKAK